MQLNTQSSQVYMELSPEETTYTGSQIRSQLIPKDWDCPLHIFRPQCSETKTQSQEDIWKQHMEVKEHPTKR